MSSGNRTVPCSCGGVRDSRATQCSACRWRAVRTATAARAVGWQDAGVRRVERTERADQEMARFARVGGDGDCWRWTGMNNGRGYGLVHLEPGRRAYAHRYAWVVANGCDVPSGRLVCHTCDNRWCVNPAHLYAGTMSDNARDAVIRGRIDRVASGRKISATRRAWTHCKNGHPLSGDNLYRTPSTGQRVCRTCKAALAKARACKRRVS